MPVGLYRSRRQKDCTCPPALLCSAVRGLQPNQQARGERKLGSSAACFFLFFFFFLYSLACAGLHLASKPKGLAQHVGGRPGRGAATPSPEHSPKSPGIPKVCCSAQRAEASLFSSPFLLWPQKKRKKKRGQTQRGIAEQITLEARSKLSQRSLRNITRPLKGDGFFSPIKRSANRFPNAPQEDNLQA